jgi:hypothetical protein
MILGVTPPSLTSPQWVSNPPVIRLLPYLWVLVILTQTQTDGPRPRMRQLEGVWACQVCIGLQHSSRGLDIPQPPGALLAQLHKLPRADFAEGRASEAACFDGCHKVLHCHGCNVAIKTWVQAVRAGGMPYMC